MVGYLSGDRPPDVFPFHDRPRRNLQRRFP
jgi:hypothetical protein